MDTQTTQGHIAEKKGLRFVHVAIIVAIVIVLNLFSNYAVSLVFHEPSYDAYIQPTQVVEDITNNHKSLNDVFIARDSASRTSPRRTRSPRASRRTAPGRH